MPHYLKDLIVEGQIDHVHKTLLELCQNGGLEYFENAILLSRIRHNNIASFLNMELYSSDEYQINYNKFNVSLLEITDKILNKADSLSIDIPQSPAETKNYINFKLNQNEIIERAQLNGTIYTSENPKSAQLIREGQRIKEDDLVYLIEEMKNYNYVFSEFGGVIKRVFVRNGQRINYNDLIYILELDSTRKSLNNTKSTNGMNSLNKRDIVSLYAPIFGKSKKIKQYITLNPLSGELILPNVNKLIQFSRSGISKGECLCQIKVKDSIYDIISPFDCQLNEVLKNDKEKIKVQDSIFTVTINKLNTLY